jgi:hypothetical protein
VKHLDGCHGPPPGGRYTVDVYTICTPAKVFVPYLCTWVEQRHRVAVQRVKARNLRSFIAVACGLAHTLP